MKKIIYTLFLCVSIIPHVELFPMEENDQPKQAIHPNIRNIAEELAKSAEVTGEHLQQAAKIYSDQQKAAASDATKAATQAQESLNLAQKELLESQKLNEDRKRGWEGAGWQVVDGFAGGVGSGAGQLSIEAIKYLCVKLATGTPLDQIIQEATLITNDALSKLQGASNLRRNDPNRKLTEFLAGQALVWSSLQVDNAIHANNLTFFQKLPFTKNEYKNVIDTINNLYKNNQEYAKIAFDRTYDTQAVEIQQEYLQNRMEKDMKSLETVMKNASGDDVSNTDLTNLITQASTIESIYQEGSRSARGPYKKTYRDAGNKAGEIKRDLMQKYNNRVNTTTKNTPAA